MVTVQQAYGSNLLCLSDYWVLSDHICRTLSLVQMLLCVNNENVESIVRGDQTTSRRNCSYTERKFILVLQLKRKSIYKKILFKSKNRIFTFKQ